MGKIRQYKYIILIGLVVLGLAFYWFQIRPAQIRKECARSVINESPVFYKYTKIMNDDKYKSCLKMHGLEK